MKFYLVGGAVRDIQMGINPKDYDFVVVGASPEDFKDWKCVGNDFPVFLEPNHSWEVALARIERKVGTGYTGFESDWKGVTLKDDLMRRDLTINSLAIEVDFGQSILEGYPILIGEVIDYFGGLYDIDNRLLRPVSEAFKEDPVRLLRSCRFFARYGDFQASDSLLRQCMELSTNGELLNLVPERVWQETEKAMKEKFPRQYFSSMMYFDLPFVVPFKRMYQTVENNDYHQETNVFEHTMMVLDHASENWNDPEINFACLMHDIAKPKCYKERGNGHGHDKEGVPLIGEFCKTWKVPNNYRDLAKITAEHHQKVHTVLGRNEQKMTRPKSIMKLFENTAALSKPERFKKMLKACESDAKGRIGKSANDDYIQRQYLEECLGAVILFNKNGAKELSKRLLQEGKSGIIIGQTIREARIHEIRKVQNKWKHLIKSN